MNKNINVFLFISLGFIENIKKIYQIIYIDLFLFEKNSTNKSKNFIL